jgi:uncharacterized repeat protein (TIGR02543 family)
MFNKRIAERTFKMKKGIGIAGIALAALFTANAAFAAGELFPFPQGKTFAGCLKPSKGQTALNADVLNFYNNNYKQYIVGPSSDGQYYIAQQMDSVQDDNGAYYNSITTSEAHGYGMIIVALMSGTGGDPNGKAIFDGMLKFAQNHPSSLDVNGNLMNWAPSAVSGTLRKSNCASDGDLDIAYSLILADKQWGSAGTYNYLNIAKTRMAAIRSSIFDATTHRITIDDNNDSTDYCTRSSDWILDHIHAFASVDAANATTYNAVVTEALSCISIVANSTTGLVPDFVTGSTPVPDPNAAGTGEPNGQYYYYNGCRYPWRIAMDYMHFGTAASQTAASKLVTWAFGATHNHLDSLISGYKLDGTPLESYGGEREFVAPMAVAAAVTGNQAMTDNGWSSITSAVASSGTGVYSNGIAMACMLAISGNWWNPVTSTPADTNTVFLYLTASGNNGTITNSAGTTTFNKTQNTNVTLTAVPNTGYVFVNWTGDATGTNPTVSVIMNKTKNITANFATTSPNLIPFMTWEANVDALGSTVVIDSSNVHTGTIGAALTTVKNKNYDSYSNLEGYLDTNLAGSTKISITYTSSKDFWFSLDQTGTNGFGIVLQGSATSKTMDISISGTTVDVKKPSWDTANPTLNLAEVTGLSFDPVAGDSDDAAVKAISGSITVTAIKINGYIGNATAKVRFHNSIPVTLKTAVSVKAGQLKLAVPKQGNYHVSLYGIDGRVARNVATKLIAGENSINLNGIARGEYIVSVKGAVSFSKRIFIGQ